jgi:high-affinity nickel permease
MNIKETIKLTAIGILVALIIGVISVGLIMSFCSALYAHIVNTDSVNNSTIGLIFVLVAFYVIVRKKFSTAEYQNKSDSIFSR